MVFESLGSAAPPSSRPRALPALTLLTCLLSSHAQAQAQARGPWQAPTLSITRYDEDWSDLADPDRRAHHWTGPFKYIPLGDDAWLSTGIELRIRNENYDNTLWGDAPSDGYVWFRALPYADLHVGAMRAFVQAIAATATSVKPAAGPIDRTGFDLLQGFAEADLGALTLRAGRQMLSLGSERLIGTRYGPNVPLAFDGLRANVARSNGLISLLAMRPVNPATGNFDDSTSSEKALWGLYTTLPTLDLYYLGYRNDYAQWGSRSGGETRHSLGARWHDRNGNWHWNLEDVYQFGRFAGSSISAWTTATEIGHTFPKAALAPDLTLRLNIASGDHNPDDKRLESFNALFPKGKYFGELSPIGPSNLINLHPTLDLQLSPTITTTLAAAAYWRQSRNDGVYDIPGHLLRPAGHSRARYSGSSLEASVSWQATAELELSTSASAFVPGTFIRQTGNDKTIGMLGAEANFRF